MRPVGDQKLPVLLNPLSSPDCLVLRHSDKIPTIFALQTFDQTGLDFLKNYMGDEYANAISTLPRRHAILVGKASSSARPIILEILDLADHWREMKPLAAEADLMAIESVTPLNRVSTAQADLHLRGGA